MSETAAIIASIIGSAVTVVGVTIATARILITSISRELGATNKRIDDLKTDVNGRIDDLKTNLNTRIDDNNTRITELRAETSRRFETLTSGMHQGFEQVNRELAENRERMAKLEGSLDGFLAGRRDRDAA